MHVNNELLAQCAYVCKIVDCHNRCDNSKVAALAHYVRGYNHRFECFLNTTIHDHAHPIIEHILISYIVDGLHIKAKKCIMRNW